MICWTIHARLGTEVKKTDLPRLCWFLEYIRLELKSLRISEIKSFFGDYWGAMNSHGKGNRHPHLKLSEKGFTGTSQSLGTNWIDTCLKSDRGLREREMSWVGTSQTFIHTRVNVLRKFLETRCSLWGERKLDHNHFKPSKVLTRVMRLTGICTFEVSGGLRREVCLVAQRKLCYLCHRNCLQMLHEERHSEEHTILSTECAFKHLQQ